MSVARVASGSDTDADTVFAVPSVLKVKQNRPFHPSTKAKAVVVRQSRMNKEDDLMKAVDFCKKNNVLQ